MQESNEHAAIVELFRQHPELAGQLLASVFAIDAPATARVVDPVQRPADLVIELGSPPTLIVIIEVQRRIDPDKLHTWPAYLWLERLRRRCDCCLLVIAPDPAVAAWAARPITSGPGSITQVLVLGPDQLPRITDPAQALAHPALTLLSARAHGHRGDSLAVFRAAVAVLTSLNSTQRRMYIDLVFGGVRPEQARRIKEELMLEGFNLDDLYPPAPWPTPDGDAFLMSLIEALTPKVVAHERQLLLLRLIAKRGLHLSPEHLSRIQTCVDATQFELWFDRAITVASADELFAEPPR